MAFEIDPMEPESLSALTAEINRRLGPIEILVNNTATITPLGSTADLSLSKILQAFIINVVSVMTLSTAVLPQMSAGRWGRIVNVTAGLGGDTARLPGANIYATTMAAVEAHTLHLAAELEGSGVTVNVFRPGRTSIDADLWIRGVRHRPSDDELITRFARALSQDHVVSPHHSGQILTPNLAGDETGQIWRATTPDSASR
jgi:3-oxoacyl-[acyl-carrier protein] reductase